MNEHEKSNACANVKLYKIGNCDFACIIGEHLQYGCNDCPYR